MVKIQKYGNFTRYVAFRRFEEKIRNFICGKMGYGNLASVIFFIEKMEMEKFVELILKDSRTCCLM